MVSIMPAFETTDTSRSQAKPDQSPNRFDARGVKKGYMELLDSFKVE